MDVQQKNDLVFGARVTLDVGGVTYLSRIQGIYNQFLHLDTLKRAGEPAQMVFHEPVYLMQELEGGAQLFVLLRFVQHSLKAAGRDIFRIIRSTLYIAPAYGAWLAVQDFCELSVFSMHNREKRDFFGLVPMRSMSEEGVFLIVPKELPHDTFAECAFLLAGRRYQMPCRAVYGEKSDNGAYCSMKFAFVYISQSDRLRIRRHVFLEQARRLREA